MNKEELQAFLSNETLKLKPRQDKLSLPIIQRICHKMKLNVDFPYILVDDDLIVNGHHRYICSEIMKKPIGINKWQKPDNAVELDWRNVVVEEIDYDEPEKVIEHNRRDAESSGLDIEIFNSAISEEID